MAAADVPVKHSSLLLGIQRMRAEVLMLLLILLLQHLKLWTQSLHMYSMQYANILIQ